MHASIARYLFLFHRSITVQFSFLISSYKTNLGAHWASSTGCIQNHGVFFYKGLQNTVIKKRGHDQVCFLTERGCRRLVFS